MPWIGENIGRYAVVEQIGSGGMGVVLKARDEELRRWVAIKVLGSTDEHLKRRFVAEARALAQVSHPNIATIYEVLSDGPYLVLEFLDGVSLSSLARRGPMSAEAVRDVIGQVAAGLCAVHERGIVHRDVKPSNIMRLDDGRIKLIDFGIAKWEGDPEAANTQTGAFVGTLRFAAPEIVRGEAATPASDIYSLGTTAYALLTGSLPYGASSLQDLIADIQHKDLQLPEVVKATMPTDLISLVGEMIEKDPRDRPAQMNDIIDRVTGAAGFGGARAEVIPRPAESRKAAATTPTRVDRGVERRFEPSEYPKPSYSRTPAPKNTGGSSGVSKFVAAGLVIASATALGWALRGGDPPAEATATQAAVVESTAAPVETAVAPVNPAPPPVKRAPPERAEPEVPKEAEEPQPEEPPKAPIARMAEPAKRPASGSELSRRLTAISAIRTAARAAGANSHYLSTIDRIESLIELAEQKNQDFPKLDGQLVELERELAARDLERARKRLVLMRRVLSTKLGENDMKRRR